MQIQSMIQRGEVDFAAWRKRRQKRETSGVASFFKQTTLKPKNKKFDYLDPVEDMNKSLLEVPMTNLHQMKFHEMKVEREVSSSLKGEKEKPVDKPMGDKTQKQEKPRMASLDAYKGGFEPAMRSTNFTNFNVDSIEQKVTLIMQKYCTPTHPLTSRFEQPMRHSQDVRSISSLTKGDQDESGPQNQDLMLTKTMIGFQER